MNLNIGLILAYGINIVAYISIIAAVIFLGLLSVRLFHNLKSK
jgi:hypothetical protein